MHRMPDLERALAAVQQLYSGAVTAHGATPAAVGWRDESAQRVRFERLARVLDDHPHDAADPVFELDHRDCGGDGTQPRGVVDRRGLHVGTE